MYPAGRCQPFTCLDRPTSGSVTVDGRFGDGPEPTWPRLARVTAWVQTSGAVCSGAQSAFCGRTRSSPSERVQGAFGSPPSELEPGPHTSVGWRLPCSPRDAAVAASPPGRVILIPFDRRRATDGRHPSPAYNAEAVQVEISEGPSGTPDSQLGVRGPAAQPSRCGGGDGGVRAVLHIGVGWRGRAPQLARVHPLSQSAALTGQV